MAKQFNNNIKILFVCLGNMFRGIPIGLKEYGIQNNRWYV